MILKNSIKKLNSPTGLVFLSYLAVVLIGGFLLYLPVSQSANVEVVPFIDALFISTSATCVTGLVTVVTASQWSLFGQTVILCLIQVGGLSVIAVLSLWSVMMHQKLSLNQLSMLQTIFNQSSLGGTAKIVPFVLKVTFLLEGICAFILFLFFMFQEGVIWYRALYYGIFHSISAFCNAGFDVLGDNSLINYSNSIVINVVIMFLIIAGGIGFGVWLDLKNAFINKSFRRLSVHTKLALFSTAALLTFGMLFFLFIEYNNPETIGSFSLPHKMLATLFQSTTLRTAGFASINQAGLNESSKFMSTILMIIGGSPGGMAGGIKTVTISVLFVSVYAIVRGRSQIQIFSRSISTKTLQKALTVVVIMILLLFFITGVVSILETDNSFPHTFIDIMYECASALATVGVTTGITPFLSSGSKGMLIAAMIIGRVGPITIIYTLTQKSSAASANIKYPEADVLIG